MLTPMQRRAVEQNTGGHPLDATRNLIALRGTGNDPETLRIILDKRAWWLDHLSVSQRQWQRGTRNPRKANHYDSIALREKYVRCVEEDRVPKAYRYPYIPGCGGPGGTYGRKYRETISQNGG